MTAARNHDGGGSLAHVPQASAAKRHRTAATKPADRFSIFAKPDRAAPTHGDTPNCPWALAGDTSTGAVVIIGDTHHIQLCWAAVSDSHTATHNSSTPPIAQ